jgi:PAS domain S-box-containing protein
MNPYAFISLLSSIVAIFLGNFIYYKNPNNRLNKLIAVLCFLVAYLAFIEFGLRQSETISTAYIWLKATFLWPFLMPLLLIIILEVTKKLNLLKNQIFIILLFIPSILISLSTLFTNQFNNGLVLEYWGWNGTLSTNILLLTLTSLWIISLGISSIIVSYRYYRTSHGIERVEILYILTGLTVVLVLSLITELILPILSIKFPELTYISASLGLIFIAYGVSNYRLPSLTPTLATNEIVTNITNFLVITDCNKRINYINPVGLKLLGYKESEMIKESIEIILPEYNMLSSKDSNFKEYIKDFETVLNLKDGKSIPIQLSTSYILKKSSAMGILLMGKDISERKATERKKRVEIKQTINRQSVLLDLYKEDFSNLETSLKHLTETVSKTLNVDRVSVWFFNDNKSVLKCSDLYKLDDNSHENGLKLSANHYPKYIAALESSKNIIIEDTHNYEDTIEFNEEYIKPNNIISILNVPIWLHNELVGVLSIEQIINKKKWALEEQDFVASISYILSLSLEASKRDKAQKQIINSLEEKDVLLREIHHRVKNNMQIISSLLNLQSSSIENPEIKDIFNQSQNRVKSMSMIHEQLYRADDLAKINFNDYVNGLIKRLFQIYSTKQKQIGWDINVQDINLNIETAIPCGLIINELVSNSLKHAFKDRSYGKIDFKMERYDDSICFSVSDNGVGIQDNFQIENSPTLGLNLVNSLVNQLDGEIKIKNDNGISFDINFKEIDYKKRI